MLVSGRVNACRIEFSHTQLRPSVPTKVTATEPSYILHWSTLSLNQLILKKQSNLGELGISGVISCNLIVRLDQHSKFTHPNYRHHPQMKLVFQPPLVRGYVLFQGLLRKPKQHQVKRNQEHHCGKNEETYFHCTYIHYTNKYYAYINTQYTSFHLISPHIRIVSDIPSTGEPYRHPFGTFRCLKRSRISKGICRRTSCFAVAPKKAARGSLSLGWCMIMSWGKYTYKFRF